MKLMTCSIEKAIPPLYSQDGKNPKDVKIVVKYFSTRGNYRWYVTEGNKLSNGDWELYGLVRGQGTELGYFLLSELEALSYIERDLYFGDHTLAEAKEKTI